MSASSYATIVTRQSSNWTQGLGHGFVVLVTIEASARGGSTRANFLLDVMISQSAANLSVERPGHSSPSPLRTDVIR